MVPAAECFRPVFLSVTGSAGQARIRTGQFRADTPRGLCLLLNGQTEFIEKYFEVIDELRGRGFSVVTFDWRGQGGSDRLLPNPRKAHIADFAAYDQDLDSVIKLLVRPTAADLKVPVIAMAHSMGGNILLRRLHDVQQEFACAILCSPMLAIKERGLPWWLVERIAAWFNRKGVSTDFVWGVGGRDQLHVPFSLQIVTSDPKRYARTHAILVAHSDLRLNGPTWGWLAAAFRSMDLLQTPGYAEAITTPSLLFGAGHDQVCESEKVRIFATRMKRARYVEVPDAQHEILMERDVFRVQLWSAFDSFIKESAPAFSR